MIDILFKFQLLQLKAKHPVLILFLVQVKGPLFQNPHTILEIDFSLFFDFIYIHTYTKYMYIKFQRLDHT